MKCPNCKSKDNLVLVCQYWCRQCGEIFGFDGQHLVTPNLTRWRKFDEEPLLGNLILIRDYYGNITACRLQPKCEIEDFKKLSFRWIPVFLPTEEKNESIKQ